MNVVICLRKWGLFHVTFLLVALSGLINVVRFPNIRRATPYANAYTPLGLGSIVVFFISIGLRPMLLLTPRWG